MSSSEHKRENTVWKVAAIPAGVPDKNTFKLEAAPIVPPQDGEVLLQVKFVSVDPYLRNVLNRTPVGTSIVSGSVAEVIESKHAEWKVGDVAMAYLPWQKYLTTKPSAEWRKLDPSSKAPISTALGVLGMPGRTAYFGLLDVCKAKAGETVLVSGAAGAVGLMVGQIAKIIGCKVIGTAGGPAKCKLIKDLGFDAAIDYKQYPTADAVRAAISAAAPEGIDCYFDNTGDHVTEAAYELLKKYGRVAVCGAIANYNSAPRPVVPVSALKVIYNSINVRGFVVTDYNDRAAEFYKVVPEWVAAGKIQIHETITEGFEHIPEAFIGLFSGANTGKAVIKV